MLELARRHGIDQLVLYWDATGTPNGMRLEHGRISLASGPYLLWWAEAAIGSVLPPSETILDARLHPPLERAKPARRTSALPTARLRRGA